MFNKKSLFIVALVALLVLSFAGIATAQAPDYDATPFRVYNFCDINMLAQVAFYATDKWEEYYGTDINPFIVDLRINDGYLNWTGLLGFYFRLDGTVWEGDDSSLAYYGRFRINFNDAATLGTRLDYSYVAWNFSDTGVIYAGNTRYSTFYSTSNRTNYLEMNMNLDMLTFALGLRAVGDVGDGVTENDSILGLQLYSTGYYEFLLGLWNIDLEPMSISVTAIYGFMNTFEWDSAAEYTDGSRTETENEKAGYLWADLDFSVSLEDLMDISLNDTLYVGFSTGTLKNEVILNIEVNAVENLNVGFTAMFAFETYSEVVIDGYTLPSYEDVHGIPMFILLPIEFRLSYSLDMGNMEVVPHLNAYADLGGLMQDDVWADKRGWYLEAGADINLAGGYITIPIQVWISNDYYWLVDAIAYPTSAGYVISTIEFYNMYYYNRAYSYSLHYGNQPTYTSYYLPTIMISVGIAFNIG